MPGARSLCEWAKRHGGRNLILTNYPADIAVAFLRAHSMEDLIEGIFSIDQGYLPKPAPAMILAALGRYGLEADETLLIGNRRIDIEAAMNAGVHTCLIGKAALTGNAEFRIQSYGFLLDRLAEMQIDSHSLSNACLFLPPQSTLFLNPSARPYCPGIAIVAARCDI
ncbi:MAG: HAD hydrolase-like protein, partial [Rectinema sp.]|nr:HAD hydrolase-like protein [Rectinema sp.]